MQAASRKLGSYRRGHITPTLNCGSSVLALYDRSGALAPVPDSFGIRSLECYSKSQNPHASDDGIVTKSS